MASPKSGKAPSPQTPLQPKGPAGPSDATGGSKSAVTPADPPPPHVPPAPGGGGGGGGGTPSELSWIELELKDEDGVAVVGEPYEVKLPDGSVAPGTTDERGVARIEGFKPGTCEVKFPRMDKSEWKKA